MKYLTNHELHVMGLIRTGQHAIISWIIGHFEKVCFKNGMTVKQPRYSTYIGPPWWYFDLEKRPDFKWEVNKQEAIRFGQDAVVLGTEFMRNTKLQMTPNLEWLDEMAVKAGYNEFSKNKHYILVLRSPHNHFSSVLRFKDGGWFTKPERFISRWKMVAKEALEVTDDLPHPKTFIKYDQWFTDEDYRKAISSALGLPFSDRGLNVVMRVGVRQQVGSSFDQMSYQGKAQNMKTLDRWEKYADDPRFQAVMRDEELREMAHQLFGEIPQV